MRPSRPSSGKSDLFRERLDSIINLEHSLVQLGAVIPWDRFDHAFGGFFRPVGRAAKPTRLMVGMHYLNRHSDEIPEDIKAELQFWMERTPGTEAEAEAFSGHVARFGQWVHEATGVRV